MDSFSQTFRERLLQRYEQRSKTFFKIFVATAVFALVFLVFILIPYIGLQYDERSIAEEQTNAESQRKQLDRQIQEFNDKKISLKQEQEQLKNQRQELKSESEPLEFMNAELASKIENIELNIDKSAKRAGLLNNKLRSYDRLQREAERLPVLDVDQFVRELRRFLPEAADVVDQDKPLETLGVGADCKNRNQQEFYNCLVRAYVMEQLSGYSKTIETKVVIPIRSIDADVAAAANQNVKQAIDNFDSILDSNPGFWQAITMKRHVGRQFKEKLDQLAGNIRQIVETQLHMMESQVQDNLREQRELEKAGARFEKERGELEEQSRSNEEDLKNIRRKLESANQNTADIASTITAAKSAIQTTSDELEALITRKSQIAKDKGKIEDRIKNVESPFGTLPIGLNEALQIFPLVVAMGVLIYGIIFGDVLMLRNRYHQALLDNFSAESNTIDKDIPMLAPLFVDPVFSLGSNLWRASVLCLPAVIYIISVGLIYHSWSFDEISRGSTAVIRSWSAALYVVSAALLILPIFRVTIFWRRYNAMNATLNES